MSTDVKTDVKRVEVGADDVMLRNQALAALLRQVETRPQYAHVARDNLAALRVLQTRARTRGRGIYSDPE